MKNKHIEHNKYFISYLDKIKYKNADLELYKTS